MADEPCPVLTEKPSDAGQVAYSALREIDVTANAKHWTEHPDKALAHIRQVCKEALGAMPKEVIAPSPGSGAFLVDIAKKIGAGPKK